MLQATVAYLSNGPLLLFQLRKKSTFFKSSKKSFITLTTELISLALSRVRENGKILIIHRANCIKEEEEQVEATCDAFRN